LEPYTDKRAIERCTHTAIMKFSHFSLNRDHFHVAQTINHSDEGICFKAEIPLKPGVTVLIKAENLHPNGACTCNGDCLGLRSLTLAEAKWCKEILDESEFFYEIGAQYYPPEY
ncbi:MAG: hypothetical protein LC660_08180, partial [Desulfobacteraceae bacterium]|nr:hypothetical protein [Desulfobacteraceae bacterium]